MINLPQIDKSGRDVFEKDYSVVLLDKTKVYGINIPQNIKDRIIHEYNLGNLWKKETDSKRYRMRLRVRFHTAMVFLLIKKYLSENKTESNIIIEICNDYDGHFHEIRDMIYKNLIKIILSFRFEDILQVKFNKPSLIDKVAANFRKRVHEVQNYHQLNIDINELLRILKK